MSIGAENGGRSGNRWSPVIWSGAAVLMAAPWAAMRVTEEVNWDAADFVLFGGMLVVACGTYELVARARGGLAYRAGLAVAVVTAFLLVLVNLAVGFIGAEGDPANLMFVGVLAVAVGGAALARLRPGGMALALLATAAAQAGVSATALIAGWSMPAGPAVVFVALWLAAAGLFWWAAQRGSQRAP